MQVIRHELDRFKDETIDKAHKGICDGSCENHQGLVKPFRVFHKESGFDWGYFSYCEEAQREDTESRGMELVEANKPESPQPTKNEPNEQGEF